MATPGALLQIRGLTVRAAGRTLFEPSDLDLADGQRALIVGPSGSGKSLLSSVLLGFVGPASDGVEVSGSIRLNGVELLGEQPEARDGRMGAVFQLNALGLFDDLSVDENLAFGSSDAKRRAEVAARLRLSGTERPVTQCSGGEQMRVALARTLLRGAGVLVYDEPTTGLDPAAVKQVVAAIGESHQRLSVVVTHDYESFVDFADVVLFLDPVAGQIRALPPGRETIALLHERLEQEAATEVPTAPARVPWAERLARGWTRVAVATSDVVLDALSFFLLPWTWARIAHPLDGPRVRRALRRDVAPGVGAFVGISAVLVAFTGTYFLFERLPERPYSEPLIQEDLIAGLGLIYTRVGIPLMVSVLLAAKLGAAAAAQLGHMSLTRQVDALRLLRVSTRRHLLLPTATGQLVAAWLATALGVALAYATALVVFLASHEGLSVRYFNAAFRQEISGGDALWVLGKVSFSALGVALVAYRAGIAPKRVPNQVIKGIHATLLRGLLLVLAVHAVFAFLEF